MANLDMCENIARMILRDNIGSRYPTEDEIKQAVQKTCLLCPMNDAEQQKVVKQLQASLIVNMDLGLAVVKESTYHPWLSARKAHINPYYWERYKKYLLLDQGWNENVVDMLGDVSDSILDLCGDPEDEGLWKRKGLILGDIQSGKTSNYLALCNKAADAGYKIIILLTGTLESLRKQTQERVDAGFAGVNSRNVLQKNPERKFVGVGEIDSNRTAYQFTNVLSDFNSSKLQALSFTIKGLPEPTIFVLKKNKSILENLATWLSTRNTYAVGEKIDLPLLLIDDEADNASVNTNKPEKKPTAINAAIVDVLRLFKRSSYVAVTATPFANIFIDPDLDKGSDEFNLFPSDFIYSLSAPTNYIGARRIFFEDSEYYSALETIDDVLIDSDKNEYVFRSKAKSAHLVPYLPKSLVRAFQYFLLVNAIRDLDEKKNSHRSMIVNVSQFVDVQIQVYNMVTEMLKKYQLKIQSYSKLSFPEAMKCEEIKDLHDLWQKMLPESETGYSWEAVQNVLYESVMPIETRLVNQKAKEQGVERLDYEPYKECGLRVIAVGGNSLSRGLTLEGLCVSYFDRNSQMYDTLMQMGRWFGYRRGYDRLFKIWMTPEAITWYQYVSTATDELRDEIREMRRVGLTPREFGLKVQQNMTSLFVTAKNKMRATTVVEQWISLAAEVVETPRLIASKEKCLKINLQITDQFLTDLESESEKYKKPELNRAENRAVYSGVPKEAVAKYVRSFVSHPRHIPFNARDLSDHIENAQDCPKWTVAVIGGSGDVLEKDYFSDQVCALGVHYSYRIIRRDDNCLLISGERARVGVPGATKFGLDEQTVEEVENVFKKENGNKKTIPDKPYLSVEREPILMIYIIKIDKEFKEKRKINSDQESISLVGDLPVIGLGLGFPGSNGSTSSKRVKYVINRVGEREMLNFEEDEEDEDD